MKWPHDILGTSVLFSIIKYVVWGEMVEGLQVELRYCSVIFGTSILSLWRKMISNDSTKRSGMRFVDGCFRR